MQQQSALMRIVASVCVALCCSCSQSDLALNPRLDLMSAMKQRKEQAARDKAAFDREFQQITDDQHAAGLAQQLENDETQLKNDILRNDIAELEGRPKNFAALRNDRRAIEQDKIALRESPGDPANSDMIVNLERTERLISSYNLKHPESAVANVTDIKNEMIKFRRQVAALSPKIADKISKKAR